MKKILVVIALMAMGLTAAPLVQAQSAADVQEMQRITADFQAGKITPAEFQKRIEAIQKRMGQGAYDEPAPAAQPRQQAQPQQGAQVIKKTYPGSTAGWPAASAFRRYGFAVTQPSLGNPNGITPSYTIQGEKLTIYISKNFRAEATEAAIEAAIREVLWSGADRDALQRHIAAAAGVRDPAVAMAVPDPDRKNTSTTRYNISITIQFERFEEDVLLFDLGFHQTVKWTVIEIEPIAQKVIYEH
jgi:hypothetical protein